LLQQLRVDTVWSLTEPPFGPDWTGEAKSRSGPRDLHSVVGVDAMVAVCSMRVCAPSLAVALLRVQRAHYILSAPIQTHVMSVSPDSNSSKVEDNEQGTRSLAYLTN
jgi:hypothetical protein